MNDAYYSSFSLENRYINFAGNLAFHSAGAQAFASTYGAMSFHQAVATAYETIVGTAAANAAGINVAAAIADIEARRAYFEAIAQTRMGGENQDLAIKAAAIGYMLQEGARSGVGAYGDALHAFLADAADGSAQYNVSLVGVYGGDHASA